MNEIIEGEKWKDIIGYEGLYKVSDKGRVLSVKRTVKCGKCGTREMSERILKTALHRDGYELVYLSDKGFQKTTHVHRLVAKSFIQNPERKRTVNHIDGNKENNKVENLEWATHSENMIHAWDIGLNTYTEKARNINSKPVKVFNKVTKETTHFSSAKKCSIEMGYSESWCSVVVRDYCGETKKFKVEYV